MTFAALNDQRVMSAEITIPPRGAWWGNVVVDGAEALEGAATLVIGDLELVCTIRRGEVFEGRARYRLDAGAGSWGREIGPKHYHADGGLRLSLLVADAAREAGEVIAAGFTDRIVGQSFVRERGPASRVLEQLGVSWYVANDGQTHLIARPTGLVDEPGHAVLTYKPDERTAVIATEAPAAFAPGLSVTVDDAELVISTLRLTLSEGGLRLHAWLGQAVERDRFRAELQKLIRETFPRLSYLGVYEYRVAGSTGDRLLLQLVDRTLPLPDLQKVPIRPGVPGASWEPKLASRVLVAFINGDPSRPFVMSFEAPGGDAFVPDEIRLGEAEGTVIRAGDNVTVGLETGVLVLNSSTHPGGISKVLA